MDPAGRNTPSVPVVLEVRAAREDHRSLVRDRNQRHFLISRQLTRR
ncbi:hypothetical protein GCM10011346_03240 [Oceanobacillus neutriphilus]|uniref:Uncharacterized protein n=1 Tax=Oceanobacillus neutriphilus TaxID=531815 RepID=A0ABQ2NPB6_9BACI|nr:hypothetical protein GCM10011346_03240 [Oceanobacillus neutriphilus]